MGFISPIPTDANGEVRQTGSMQSLGKDDFLQLMITKLQNQDPMNPMDDEDYIAQLAQFSTLEQMNNIADGIATSNDLDLLQMQSLNNVMASGLIGKEAQASYSSVYFDGSQESRVNFTLPATAQSVTLEIKDAQGNIVAVLDETNLQAGAHSMIWDGTDRQGNRVDEGLYTVNASAKASNGESLNVSLALVGIVESVIYREGAAFLRVAGTEIPLGDVTAVGEPGAFSGSTSASSTTTSTDSDNDTDDTDDNVTGGNDITEDDSTTPFNGYNYDVNNTNRYKKFNSN